MVLKKIEKSLCWLCDYYIIIYCSCIEYMFIVIGKYKEFKPECKYLYKQDDV